MLARRGANGNWGVLAKRINAPTYGDLKTKNSIKIALNGLKKFENYDVVMVDTAGRHKNEENLISEMKVMEKAIKPDQIILVIDGTIGQQASSQANAFHKATPTRSIIVAKLDGSARGGGALSTVASIGVPISFIGTGEKIEDIELFDPARFAGRLLGMGDLKGLVEKVKEAEVGIPEKKVKAFLSGKFSLLEMHEQIESIKKLGPFGKLLRMIPGLGSELTESMVQFTEEKMQ